LLATVAEEEDRRTVEQVLPARDCARPVTVGLNPALLHLAASRRVLMLQGPVGPFFDRLGAWLQTTGATVNRVVFQGGDEFDCKLVAPIRYQGSPADWPAFFANLLLQLEPECVVLFGQTRTYHKAALGIAKASGVPVAVMEEGYFRPGFATMELGGVNGYSSTLERFTWQPAASLVPGFTEAQGITPEISTRHFQKMAWHAARHYAALWRGRGNYPNYVHHRIEDPFFYSKYWVRSWVRKLFHRGPDRRVQARLLSGTAPYYLVPLQVDGDSQLVFHSTFGKNPDFIVEVLASFARHAPSNSLLVFKQHPYSRGGPGHMSLIRGFAESLGVSDRICHLNEGDTPLLAERSAGVVVINSTVGLQALERGAPLMVLGDALYNQPKLAFQGALDEFWERAHVPDRELTQTFLSQLKNLTQVPVSLYALVRDPLVWKAQAGEYYVAERDVTYLC
jgi:capsular polysaccharide export protein